MYIIIIKGTLSHASCRTPSNKKSVRIFPDFIYRRSIIRFRETVTISWMLKEFSPGMLEVSWIFFPGEAEQACIIVGGGDPVIPSIGTLNIPLAHDFIMLIIWNGMRPSPPGVI